MGDDSFGSRSDSRRDKNRPLLIQFAKAPVLGTVKTRLTPPLSEHQALNLHLSLMAHTAQRLQESKLGDVELWLSTEVSHPAIESLQQQGLSRLAIQSGENLGERICAALNTGLAQADKVVLVGSDCPGIDAEYLHAAIRALDDADVVLGPARDGGYVLIAVTRCCNELFAGVDWGTDRVLQQTICKLKNLDWHYTQLQVMDDIDRPEDLNLLSQFDITI